MSTANCENGQCGFVLILGRCKESNGIWSCSGSGMLEKLKGCNYENTGGKKAVSNVYIKEWWTENAPFSVLQVCNRTALYGG